jgi:hypothetical protein
MGKSTRFVNKGLNFPELSPRQRDARAIKLGGWRAFFPLFA